MTEHMKAIDKCDQKNAIAKHNQMVHDDNKDTEYVSEIIKGNFKYNIDRLISESLIISKYTNSDTVQLLNSKSEWGHNGVNRLVPRIT